MQEKSNVNTENSKKVPTMKVKGWIRGFVSFLNRDSILESEIERRREVEDLNNRFANRERRRGNR